VTRSVVSVGNFDGVHAGHAALLDRACAEARRIEARVVILTFDPHPAATLAPHRVPPRLTTMAQRREALAALGADDIVRLEPTRELLGLEPREFVERLIDEHGMAGMVEGSDFRFGRRRAGDAAALRSLGAELGFETHIVDAAEVDLTDQSLVRASSSITRWLIECGRVLDAWRVLGRPHELLGEVVRGDRRGRDLGFPTANLRTGLLPPADGVYAAVAVLDDDRELPAAVSVGTNPQFDGQSRTIEAHLLDAERDGDAIAGFGEYGWTLRLRLVGWVRDQTRFESVEHLIDQIALDCRRVRAIVGESADRVAAMAKEPA